VLCGAWFYIWLLGSTSAIVPHLVPHPPLNSAQHCISALLCLVPFHRRLLGSTKALVRCLVPHRRLCGTRSYIGLGLIWHWAALVSILVLCCLAVQRYCTALGITSALVTASWSTSAGVMVLGFWGYAPFAHFGIQRNQCLADKNQVLTSGLIFHPFLFPGLSLGRGSWLTLRVMLRPLLHFMCGPSGEGGVCRGGYDGWCCSPWALVQSHHTNLSFSEPVPGLPVSRRPHDFVVGL
jgi:hypothetical protein